jgi:hypothetical protein
MIKIKNWHKFQHFKDRTPPWIKLYRELLDDPDWHDLDPEAAKVLIGLWLIASEDESHSGNLPEPRKLAFRLRIKESQLNQALTKLSHWLEQDDIKPISPRYQSDAPETETETEKRQKVVKPEGVKDSTWDDFLKHRRTKKALVTERVIADISQQAKMAGWSMEAALHEVIVRNWQSFKAEWVAKKSVAIEDQNRRRLL